MGAKLIASDYDGTLRQNGRDSGRDFERIADWRRAGNIFGVVTGRGDCFPELAAQAGFEYDFLCCCSGALIFDADGGKIYESSGGAEVIEGITSLAVKRLARGIELCLFEDADGGRRFYQCSVRAADDDAAREFARETESLFAGKLSPYRNGCNIDIVPFGVSKATGILAAARHFGAAREDITSIGDNFNDLPMLLEFGGYAVDSADAEIRDKVGRTCAGVGELIDILLK